MKHLYLDNSATTQVRSEVLSAMQPYFSEKYGNPSSFHYKGLEAKNAMAEARAKIAKILNCKPAELVFTSGGTESINLALKGAAQANKSKGNHIITSKIEHPAVLETCKYLEGNGFKVTYLPVNKEGIVSPSDLSKSITNQTVLVSIMYANNETGSIQPIQELTKICKAKGILFHTDGCQVPNSLSVDVCELGVDMLTLNASKIYGPKGIGLLYIKESVQLQPQMHGGGQESGMRSGTENVPSIIGFAKALELAQKDRVSESKRLAALKAQLAKGIPKSIPGSVINSPSKSLPHILNISFPGVEGESIILHLGEKGIFTSTGSACSSKKLQASHVLLAMNLHPEVAHGSVRFSLGRQTTKADIRQVLRVLPPIIDKLKRMSPLKR